MTLKEFYAAVGGNYDETMARLMTEARILKYLNKFRDTDYSPEMVAAFREERYEEAFASAHTIKGVCLNLGMDSLGHEAGVLCDMVRNGARPDAYPETEIEAFLAHYKAARDLIPTLTI